MNPCDDWHPKWGVDPKYTPQKLSQYGIEKMCQFVAMFLFLNPFWRRLFFLNGFLHLEFNPPPFRMPVTNRLKDPQF